MNNKQITLNAKGIPAILLGANRGLHGVGKGHFFCIQESDRIRALYVIGVAWTNDAAKEIAMKWGEIELGTTELKALPLYFNADGSPIPVSSKPFSFDSVSRGKTLVAPGVEMYTYDLFYDLMGTDKAGVVLYAIAMDRYFKERYGVSILKITPTGYEFIQPVTGTVVKTLLETGEGEALVKEYKVEVTPIDGVGPFTYSLGGTSYSSNGVFTSNEPITGTIFIKDSVGTIAKIPL